MRKIAIYWAKCYFVAVQPEEANQAEDIDEDINNQIKHEETIDAEESFIPFSYHYPSNFPSTSTPNVDNNDMQFFHKSEHFLAKMPSFAIPVPAKRISNQQQQTVTNDVLREYQQQKNYKIDDTPKNDHCLMINVFC